jgi:hypothetical protein
LRRYREVLYDRIAIFFFVFRRSTRAHRVTP